MSEQFAELKDAVIAGDVEAAKRLTLEAIQNGTDARQLLDAGLLPGMDIVGARMRSGDCFIPEVLLSARTMQGALDLLKPHLSEGDTGRLGVVVIGTVEGDLHDIGKNLVAMMLEGAGFEVINLGTGVSAAAFVEAAEKHGATIVAMSALLTTTLPRMKETLRALTEAGLRDTVKVMAGGAPVTPSFVEELGADGYGANAAMAVQRAKQLSVKTWPQRALCSLAGCV